MAAGRDIRAGRAFIELALKGGEKVMAGLRSARQQLKDMGTAAMAVGSILTAAGGAIITPLVAAVKQFMATGDALDKMRQRTGISVESLSELGHAAEQSGASLGDLENGVRKMQREIGKAGEQSLETKDALAALGLSADALAKMSPEQQFNTLAKAIGGVDDPTRRAALAMQFFGKSGTKLLPMIEDLEALRAEARALGFTMSGEAAASAVKLGDMLANLWKTVKFGGVAIGAELAPALIAGVKVIQRIGTQTLKWVKDNGALVISVAKLGIGLVAAGGFIIGLGLALKTAALALGGFIGLISGAAAVIGFLLSPMGLITAALVGGGIAWLKWTDSGQKAVRAVMDVVGPMLQTFKDTFSGIKDAILAGDLGLAGQIAVAGLKTALLQGVAALAQSVGDEFGDFLGTLGQQILNGDFNNAWKTALSGWREQWALFNEGLVAITTLALRGLTDQWETATKKISDMILETAAKGGILGKFALGKPTLKTSEVGGKEIDILPGVLAGLGAGSTTSGLGEGVDFEEQVKRARKLDEELRKRGVETGPDALTAAQKNAQDQIVGIGEKIRKLLDEIDREAQGRSHAAAGDRRERTKGGSETARKAAEAAEKELAALLEKAARLRAEQAAADKKAGGEGGDDSSSADSKGGGVVGAFGAARAEALSMPSGPMDRTAKATEQTAKAAEEIAKNTQPGAAGKGAGAGAGATAGAGPATLPGKGFLPPVVRQALQDEERARRKKAYDDEMERRRAADPRRQAAEARKRKPGSLFDLPPTEAEKAAAPGQLGGAPQVIPKKDPEAEADQKRMADLEELAKKRRQESPEEKLKRLQPQLGALDEKIGALDPVVKADEARAAARAAADAQLSDRARKEVEAKHGPEALAPSEKMLAAQEKERQRKENLERLKAGREALQREIDAAKQAAAPRRSEGGKAQRSLAELQEAVEAERAAARRRLDGVTQAGPPTQRVAQALSEAKSHDANRDKAAEAVNGLREEIKGLARSVLQELREGGGSFA